MSATIAKSPRLYNTQTLASNLDITLEGAQAHYLRNVMRMNEGDNLRIFNEKDGEFQADITGISKKSVTLHIGLQRRAPAAPVRRIHLFFAPLKKNRMDFVIEKSVELGVTDLHPLITAHTEVRKINEERLQAQIIEAAEQCERLNIPALHGLAQLDRLLGKPPKGTAIFAALERHDGLFIDKALAQHSGDIGFIIGPVGGFNESETAQMLACAALTPISLGRDILRAETAAIFCLAKAKNT